MLAAVILVVFLAFQLIGGGGGSGKKPVAKPIAAATTPPPTVTPPPSGAINVSLATGTAACDPAKVLVTPSVRTGQYAGSAVTVAMNVSTTQADPCVLDAKAANLLVVISSNKKPVWDSTLCQTGLLGGPVSLTPQWATVVQTTWTGRGSGAKCSPSEAFAGPGTYVIKSATLGGDVGQAGFDLARRPAPRTPKPTVTAAPKSPKTPKTPKPTKPTPTATATTKHAG